MRVRIFSRSRGEDRGGMGRRKVNSSRLYAKRCKTRVICLGFSCGNSLLEDLAGQADFGAGGWFYFGFSRRFFPFFLWPVFCFSGAVSSRSVARRLPEFSPPLVFSGSK